MNPELDGTLGPLLKAKADKAGVVFTDVDGDQPGVEMNLFRFVKGLGVRPVLCGNIKGLQDPYRTPTTQKAFAERWGQKPAMVTSFADGTKVSFEQAVVANATGMTVAKRGMHGYTVEAGTPLMEAAKLWDPDELLAGPGIVDYVVGASPRPGRLRARHDRAPAAAALPQPLQARRGADLLLLHPLPPLPLRGADHDRAGGAVPRRDDRPHRRPQVEVVAIAKRDLAAGEVIDELGGYLVYGEAESAAVTARDDLLPIGVAVGCRLRHAVAKDRLLDLRRRRGARRAACRRAARRAGGPLRAEARRGLRRRGTLSHGSALRRRPPAPPRRSPARR